MQQTISLEPRRHGKTLKSAISARILELDGDISSLKERREWAWLPAAEIRQYSRLIKLFEETITELQRYL